MSNTPSTEDLIELGYLKPGDVTFNTSKRKWSPFLDKSDLDYAHRHGLTDREMKDFKEDMIVEEEILKLHYEMVEKHDTKPHFAW
tara:strand:- start:1618 stop:1872 length:255 start_codon:yes stop_codon:yes gene_type:complete